MKKYIGILFIVVLLVIGFFVFPMNKPKRVAANVIFNEAGKYRSPAKDIFVEIIEVEGGKLKFSFYKQKKNRKCPE